MSKSVVINLVNGDLYQGVNKVIVQIWVWGHPLPEQFVGSLPAAPNLVEIYNRWRSVYQNLCDRQYLRSRLVEDDDELEIDDGGTTNISRIDFDKISQELQASVSNWLKSEEFLKVECKLRSALDRQEEIQVIIQTSDLWLRRLPWYY